MRALGREPVLSAVLRRGVSPPSASVRPLVAHALAPAHGGHKLVALIAGIKWPSRLPMGAAKPADFRQVVIDTTVQEKAIAFPTDAKLMTSRTRAPGDLAERGAQPLRQSYVRVGKIALIRHQRYAHAEAVQAGHPSPAEPPHDARPHDPATVIVFAGLRPLWTDFLAN